MKLQLFPVNIFHGSVPDNQKLKDILIPEINRTKTNLITPDSWFTNHLVTSFAHDDVNAAIFNDPQIRSELQKQYTHVIQSFLNEKEWGIDILSMWYNCYENGEYQESHCHISCVNSVHFACVHFLSFDPEFHSPLTLIDPLAKLRSHSVELSRYSEKVPFECNEGDLVMFPSYLDHEVKASNPTPGNPRITVSFNFKLTQYGNFHFK